MDNLLNSIITDIKRGGCVLVLGPDIIDFGGKTFFEAMVDELNKNDLASKYLDKPPLFIFKNEELFQLHKPDYETKMVAFVLDFYSKQEALNEPLNMISQIPFHLIISLLPDSRLKHFFQQQNFRFESSYYPRKKAPDRVEIPTPERPLIYNLFGDSDINKSANITFDNMFSFLVGIIGGRPLPSNLQIAIKKAGSFLFLGVQFEKWYSQLLLKILTSNEVIKSEETDTGLQEKYSILKEKENSEENKLRAFVADRLSLDFRPNNPHDFLKELYLECQKQNVLKISKKSSLATVFLSYSHKDEDDVKALWDFLRSENIEVIIDQNAMHGGQKIEHFIQAIKNVDIVLPILSQNSFRSSWVVKEITLAVYTAQKEIIPCYIDESYLDKEFTKKAKEMVDDKLRKITERMKERSYIKIDDLRQEQTEWIDYYENLPTVFSDINKVKCLHHEDKKGILNAIKLILKK